MFNKIKSIINKNSKSDVLPEILNITIGRTIIIDPMITTNLGETTYFCLDSGTLPITAQGIVDLSTDSDTSFVHRFYTDDDVLFQVMTNCEDGGDIQEISVFVPFDSAYPDSPQRLQIWEQRLKADHFSLDDGTVFERVWFDDNPGPTDLVKFWENVYDDRERTDCRRIYQSCMLFARELQQDLIREEFLLALIMEPENGDTTVELMIGIPLSKNDFLT